MELFINNQTILKNITKVDIFDQDFSYQFEDQDIKAKYEEIDECLFRKRVNFIKLRETLKANS